MSMGIFDGVHRGHRNLIEKLRDLARLRETGTLLVTFWPHPRIVLGKAGMDFHMLTSLEEKTDLLRQTGIDHLLILPFTQEFAALPAERFLDEIIGRFIRPGVMVVGDDLHFGAGGSGNLDLLIRYGIRDHFDVVRMETHAENEERISSTRIRSCLMSGDLPGANQLLGYPYFITGAVIRGHRIGSSIGFPTANIECADPFKQIPADGVYAVLATCRGELRKGMLNIGFRPTFGGGTTRSIEVHLFDVAGELYGESLTVRFIDRLRPELKFDSVTGLVAQLTADRDAALKVLETY